MLVCHALRAAPNASEAFNNKEPHHGTRYETRTRREAQVPREEAHAGGEAGREQEARGADPGAEARWTSEAVRHRPSMFGCPARENAPGGLLAALPPGEAAEIERNG
jgi:hypothetical protein